MIVQVKTPERVNLAPRPNAQATGWASSFTNFTNSGSGLGNGSWTPDSGNSQFYVNGTASSGSATAIVQIGQAATSRSAVEVGVSYLVSIDIDMVARGAGAFRAGFVWLNSGGSFVSSSTADIVGLKSERITWRATAPANAAFFGFQVGHSASLANGETCTFSVADYMVEVEPDFAKVTGEMNDVFTTKPDNPLAIADTGQEWQTFNNNGDTWRMRTLDGTLTNISANAGASAGYSEVQLRDACTVVGGTFHFTGSSTTDGSAVLFVSPASIKATALVNL